MLKEVIEEQKKDEAEAAEVESRHGQKVFGEGGEISVDKFPAEVLPELFKQSLEKLTDQQEQVDAIKKRMEELGVEIPGEENLWENLSKTDSNEGTMNAFHRIYQNSLNKDGSVPPESKLLLRVIKSMEKAKARRHKV